MKDWHWQKIPEEAEHLLSSENMKKVFKKLREGYPLREIAKQNGVSYSAVAHTVERMRRKFRSHGCDPEHDYQITAANPYLLKNKTVHRKRNKETGELDVIQIWDKPQAQIAILVDTYKDVLSELAREFKPLPRVKAPKKSLSEYLTLYTLTDFHLGMYAWVDETGEDWDMDIAEKVWSNSLDDMIKGSPESEEAIFLQLGDLNHWDGLLAVTPTAQNILDADTRFFKLAHTAARICVEAVDRLLTKHKKVKVIMAEGNHDIASSVWLTVLMEMAFSKNPRVTVENTPFPYYHHVFGKVFIGAHHGHLMKMNQLVSQFSLDPKFRQDFGNCNYHYIHTGHLHTEKVIRHDIGGALVEQHPTLAARDAHAARKYLFSQRGAKAITYHADRGEYSRVTVRPRF